MDSSEEKKCPAINHNSLSIYIAVSFAAIVLNFLTITNTLPWIDEVMFTDTPANYILYNSWSTKAWYSLGNDCEPFSTYLPLYQWLLCGWIKIIGFSFVKVRLLEIILYFIEGICILSLVRKIRGVSMKYISSIVFSLCYWFFPILCMTYRMGRVDILGALMATLLVSTVYTSIKDNRQRSFLIFTYSFFTMQSGIQAAVWTVAIASFSMLYTRSYKPFIKPIACSIIGYISALLVTALFMLHMGYFNAFVVSFLNYSATLYKLWAFARQYVLPLLGRQVTKIAEIPEGDGFLQRFIVYFQDESVVLLTVCVAVLLLINFKSFKREDYKNTFFFFIFSLYATIFLNLAGRYVCYYEWMSIFPLVISLALLCEDGFKPLNRIIAIAAIVYFGFSCKDVIKSISYHEYDNVVSFIQRQNFSSSETIAAPMVAYYELKPIAPKTYYYEVYPTFKIPHIDYIILPDFSSNFYGREEMQNYFNSIVSNPDYRVELIDSCSRPLLYLYSVKRRNH